MSRVKSFLLGALLATVAMTAGLYVGSRQATEPDPEAQPPAVSQAALSQLFSQTLEDTQGEQVALAQWKGQTLVVNFWATWCPPCREEMPGFSRLQQQFSAKGVQFIGIALDEPAQVREFARAYPTTYPLLHGGPSGSQLASALGNPALALPFTLVISPQGEASFARLGALDEHTLGAQLLRTLPR